MCDIGTSKKVLFICATSKMVLHFRSDLIKRFQAEGCAVSIIAFDDKYGDEIKNTLGVDFYCVNDNNRGLNPLKVLTLKKRYLKIIKDVKPDLVFTFMMKPNIYGVRAAKKAGVKRIFSMVEGLGDVFIYNSLKWKIIRLVVSNGYRKSFKFAEKVFFLNDDDMGEFIKRKLIKEQQCERINGIGVNLSDFKFKPLKNTNTFLMVARMIETKGVLEYCKAARIVKEKYPNAVFEYIGEEGSIKLSDIQEYIDDGSIVYRGEVDDVRPYLENCAVFVLPSYYREGLPMSIMEAEATGRAIITTDNVGCRETVENEKNGFLIRIKDYNNLAEKIMRFLEDKNLLNSMGQNSRLLAKEKFDRDTINDYIIKKIFDNVEKTQ